MATRPSDIATRVVLVGDAAGLVDPLTGEGIYAAVVSGAFAAEQIVAELRDEQSMLAGYHPAIDVAIGRELALGLDIHDALHIAPGALLLALHRCPRLWTRGFALLHGEATLEDLVRGVGPLRPVLSLLSTLGHVVRVVQERRAARRRRTARRAAPA